MDVGSLTTTTYLPQYIRLFFFCLVSLTLFSLDSVFILMLTFQFSWAAYVQNDFMLFHDINHDNDNDGYDALASLRQISMRVTKSRNVGQGLSNKVAFQFFFSFFYVELVVKPWFLYNTSCTEFVFFFCLIH